MRALRCHEPHIGRATVPGRRKVSPDKRTFASRTAAVEDDRPPKHRPAQPEGEHSWSPEHLTWRMTFALRKKARRNARPPMSRAAHREGDRPRSPESFS